MKRTDKRQLLINHCRDNGSITTAQANDLLKNFYYCNHEHYVSEILSRLVKSGIFIRESRGVYKIGSTPKSTEVAKNQINLF